MQALPKISVYAGEPVNLELQFLDAAGAAESLAGRSIICIVSRNGTEIDRQTGTIATDSAGNYASFSFGSALSIAMTAKLGVTYAFVEQLQNGWDTIGEGYLIVSFAPVAAAGGTITGSAYRFEITQNASLNRVVIEQRGARGLSFSQELGTTAAELLRTQVTEPVAAAVAGAGAATSDAIAATADAVAKTALAIAATTAADTAGAATIAATSNAVAKTALAVTATQATVAATVDSVAKTALAVTAMTGANAASVAANAAAAQIVADAGATLLIKPGTGTFPVVADPYFSGNTSLYADFDGIRRNLRTFTDVIDVARAGAATYSDAAGLIQTAPAGVARLGYRYASPAWGVAGLMAEMQASNVWLNSQNLAASTGTNATLTATVITESSDSVATGHYVSQTVSATLGMFETWSAILSAKPGSAARRLFVRQGGTSAHGALANATFDPATGTVSSIANATAGMIPWGPGKWLVWLCPPQVILTTAYSIRWYTDDGTTSSYIGNGTGGLTLEEIQVESYAVRTAPSSRIRTAAAAATRPGDQLAKALGIGFNPAAGTIMSRVFRYIAPPAGSVARIWQFDDGTESNRITLRGASSTFVYEAVVGGVVTGTVTGPAWAAMTSYSVQATYDRATGAMVLRVGGTEYTATATALPAGLTTRRHGCDSAGTNQLNGFVLPFLQHATNGLLDGSYFPRVLSPTERGNYA